ncbi:MAG: hypothetical protein HKN71_05365 [Gemmatimonadetes bacterium]|nr:hypothetical protein [Gemmatimonadota bacterium]
MGCALTLTPVAGRGQIPWDDSNWDVAAQESRTGRYLGREAFYMAGGTAWFDDADFRDGVIEFDIAAPADQGFHGLRFRAVDRTNHEYVYLRPHLSGKPDAVQYTPVNRGLSSWQLYSDARFVLPATLLPDRWLHVRVAIEGRRMEMTIDGQTLVFPELQREPAAGGLGLSASGGGAWFANVVIRADAEPDFIDEPGAEAPPVPADLVTRFRVSEPFAEEVVDGVTELPAYMRSDLQWAPLPVSVRGIADLAQLRTRTPENNTVFARLALEVMSPTVVRLRLGFSDRVRVFVDGRQVFAASDVYATRDYRFLGTVGLFDELYLPLEAGETEVWFAVSEDFGGWGLIVEIPPGQGVVVR